ncbi:iron complex transport system permease protein [Crossiella equi]|uniref:Iron complex transport system permease protein n=1 Tax=Crossiella equi TaxID=130796 RepID=A0ABS5AD12_9PSEU|nr:iron chelate uptake ABC transporter family permease subunit [Crossiella equi]MBP2474461.1 iron complex transport system permease protein [Crossiella equi]
MTDTPVKLGNRARVSVTTSVLAALVLLMFCVSLAVGEFQLGLGEVVAALGGIGDYSTLLVVQELRLPRALTGLLVGLAFGVAGSLLQSLTRNPLASPDLIGITGGANVAVVLGIAFGLGSGLGVPLVALIGSLGSAFLVYSLAWQRGTTGYRIVLVGIGVQALCTGAVSYLLLRIGVYDAQGAMAWLTGTLNARDFGHVAWIGIAVAVLLPAVLLMRRWLDALQFNDDTATGLGVPVQRARLWVGVLAVGFAAVATAAAGPVVFVALVSPQLALRLCRSATPPVLASGLAGALLLLTSDLVARTLLPTELPVGVVTGVLGAPFLLWLLARANRANAG